MPKPQTLIIHKFNNLFNILNEIKNILNFEVVSDNNDKILSIEKNKNILVISGKTTFKSPNQIEIKEYPINLTKLIELDVQTFKSPKQDFNFKYEGENNKFSINANLSNPFQKMGYMGSAKDFISKAEYILEKMNEVY